MPRKHKNAAERTETKWSPDYIRLLMKKLRAGALERAYDVPDLPQSEKGKGKKK